MGLAEILAPYGVSESEYLVVLADALSSSVGPDGATLTASERRLLERHGGVEPFAEASARSWLDNVTSNVAEQLRSSLGVGQVAAVLRISDSTVRRRIREGSLYAFKLDRTLRLPTWQFDVESGQPLPGLRVVLAALDPGLHPLEVAGFMTGADSALEISDEAVSPREWLASGGSPNAVAKPGALIGSGY